jgi:hypothetical protein
VEDVLFDRIRLRVAACALVSLTLAAAPCRAAIPEGGPVFTTLIVQPVAVPSPVLGADGKRHLAYELLLVNDTTLLARVDAVAALDADTGAVLAEWKGDALASQGSRLQRLGRANPSEPRTYRLEPGNAPKLIPWPPASARVERLHSNEAGRRQGCT